MIRRLLRARRKRQAELEALERDRRELERVRSQWPDVHHLVAVLRRHRERNGFSESIAAIYRGGH